MGPDSVSWKNQTVISRKLQFLLFHDILQGGQKIDFPLYRCTSVPAFKCKSLIVASTVVIYIQPGPSTDNYQ